MTKEYALAQIHDLYRSDPWVNEIFNAAGIPADSVADLIIDIYNSNWFSDMSEAYVKLYEKKMGIVPAAGVTLTDRRSAIEAKWKASGVVTLALIQSVANSWQNGDCIATFQNGKVQITFVNTMGIPSDILTLKHALNETVPAHLPIEYMLRYWLIGEIHGEMTLEEVEQLPMNQFAGADYNAR